MIQGMMRSRAYGLQRSPGELLTEGSVREFFALVRAARAPLLVSLLTTVALALPPQVIEIYRSVAQSLAVHFADFGQRLRELALSGAALVLLSTTIWLAASFATHKRGRRSEVSDGYFSHASLLSAISAALPILGLSVGCLRALTDAPTSEIREATRAALVDIVAAGTPKSPPAQLVDAYVSRLLNYNWYIALGAVSSAVLAIVLAAVFKSVDRRIVGLAHISDPRTRALLLPLLCALAILSLCLMPVSAAITVGPIGQVCIFAAITLIVISIISFWSDRRGVPLVGFILVYVAGISWFGLNDSHRVFSLPVTSVNEEAQAAIPSVQDMFVRWYNARPDLAAFQRYPVYVIAAQGGGIYAAYHTASSIGAFQDACPSFARHTFAISGVSGGSIGAAIFAGLADAAGQAAVQRRGSPECEPEDRPRREWAKEFSFVRTSDRILAPDFLSPVLYGLLYTDFAQLFVPGPIIKNDRARQFELLLEKSAVDALVRERAEGRLMPGESSLLVRPFIEHWRADGDTPALVLNTTEVGSGLRRIISPFTFGGDDVEFLQVWQGDLRRMPVSTAAVLSARFPWITPPGWYYETARDPHQSAKTGQFRNELVDGAYFENSGVASALDVIRTIKSIKPLEAKIDLHLIILTRSQYSNETFFGMEVLAPVQAMLNARAARGYSAIRQAERELAPSGDSSTHAAIQKINLVNMGYPPPLGWRLSKITGILIEAQNGRRVACALGADFNQVKPGRFDADCVAAEIHRDLSQR
jgi:hypothetical protein